MITHLHPPPPPPPHPPPHPHPHPHQYGRLCLYKPNSWSRSQADLSTVMTLPDLNMPRPIILLFCPILPSKYHGDQIANDERSNQVISLTFIYFSAKRSARTFPSRPPCGMTPTPSMQIQKLPVGTVPRDRSSIFE